MKSSDSNRGDIEMPTPQKSNDAIPVGTIRLSDAFTMFYRATVPAWQRLENEAESTLGAYRSEAMPAESESDWARLYGQWQDAGNAHNEAVGWAELEFRKYLASGEPCGMIRDPETGDRLMLKCSDWITKEVIGRPGFYEDFVWTDGLVKRGPADTLYKDALRPVFFLRTEFDSFIQGMAGAMGADVQVSDALASTPNRRLVSDDFDALPNAEPSKSAHKIAWRALRVFYPNHNVPKTQSAERLAERVCTWASRQPGSIAPTASVSASTVARLLGRKK